MLKNTYKVPYIDLPKQYRLIEEELISAVKRVFRTASFILRDDVRTLEDNISSFLGSRYAIAVNSGTDALFLSLYAQGFRKGSEVITVGHTFIATIAAIKHCGLKPVLVDITDDFNMDTSEIAKAISSKTQVIIPVHLNGRVCDMDEIVRLGKKHNLAIIEDACQSLGASFKNKKAGTFGIGCFSLHPMKILGCAGDGGFIVTDDPLIEEKIRLLRDHGQKTKEDLVMFGFNSRLDNLQAAILNLKFKCVEGWIKKRRLIAKIYDDNLCGLSELKLPPQPEENKFYDVYNSYCVCAEKRDALLLYLRRSGIEAFAHLSKPNHFQEGLGLSHFSLPNTERLSKKVISLPIFPEMEDWQIEYVIKTIKKFYKPN